jgi:hypothetical protein
MRASSAAAVLLASVFACGGEPAPVAKEASPVCAEPDRYIVEGALVIDGELTWQRTVDPTPRTQADAAAFCDALAVDGVRGFRVPDVHELQSLLLRPIGIKDRPDACLPPIDQAAFPDTPRLEEWSATGHQYVDFADGRTHPADPSTPFYVRCVQGRSAATLEAAP